MFRRPVLLACLASLGAAAPAAAAPSACQSGHLVPSSSNVQQVERTVLCLVNRERTSRGLKRLRSNRRLDAAAVKHSRDMVRRDFFDHTSPGGTTVLARVRVAGYLRGVSGYMVGENIAWGTGSYATPQETLESWMKSPGHRANILQRRYEELGVGVALGAPGHGDGATYTTNFGSRS